MKQYPQESQHIGQHIQKKYPVYFHIDDTFVPTKQVLTLSENVIQKASNVDK